MHKRLLLVLLLLTLMPACSDSGEQSASTPPATQPNAVQGNAQVPAQQQSGFISISPQQAKGLLDSRKDLLIIDVRSQEELRAGFIEGSQLLPIWSVMRGQHNLPKDKALLLVCAVGGRSYAAGQLLARNGYPEVYNLSGGIDAWRKAGLPLKF